MTILKDCRPPGRRVSEMKVRPCRTTGLERIRGSPVSGASTSSSRATRWARASGSSSSRVGLRWPDSSRDRVLTEMPVSSARSPSVASRSSRSWRSRGPTPRSTDSSSIRTVCHFSKNVCQYGEQMCMIVGMSENTDFDVVVIGGGAAGLSGAMALGRSRRSVLVIDAGEPRNAPADHAHNYLGREGVNPLELLEIGRAEVAAYGVEVLDDRVVGLSGEAGSFLVTTVGGRRVTARRVLVTGGGTDELPDVPGLAERWGKDVLHCPYCHGWEVRDQRLV